MKMLLATLALSVLAVPAIAQEFEAGKDYRVLDRQVRLSKSDKIEVVEVFSYTCPHCAALDPHVERWASQQASDVDFLRLPIVWGGAQAGLQRHHARTYYALVAGGWSTQIHPHLFQIIQQELIGDVSVERMQGVVARLGADEAEFLDEYFALSTRIKAQRAQRMTRDWLATSVPAIVINGKYLIFNTPSAGRLFRIVDELVAMERRAIRSRKAQSNN